MVYRDLEAEAEAVKDLDDPLPITVITLAQQHRQFQRGNVPLDLATAWIEQLLHDQEVFELAHDQEAEEKRRDAWWDAIQMAIDLRALLRGLLRQEQEKSTKPS